MNCIFLYVALVISVSLLLLLSLHVLHLLRWRSKNNTHNALQSQEPQMHFQLTYHCCHASEKGRIVELVVAANKPSPRLVQVFTRDSSCYSA